MQGADPSRTFFESIFSTGSTGFGAASAAAAAAVCTRSVSSSATAAGMV